MKYRIISNTSQGELVEKVNEAIEEGWSPQGGMAMAVRPAGDDLGFAQAMVK